MKSIIEDALARSASDEKSESPQQSYSSDTELEEVLKTLQTNIIVVGCGGAGSNTVTRMMEEGIEGAELIAINTDAQHLRLSLIHISEPTRLGMSSYAVFCL